MKKCISCCIIAIAITTLGIGIYSITKKSATPTAKSEASVNKIDKINFPKPGGEIPENLSFTLDKDITFSDEKIKPGSTDKSDTIFEYKIATNNDEKLSKLKKAFNLDGAKQTNEDKYILLDNDNASFSFNEDGTYLYHSKKKDDTKENLISDKEAINIAKKFLQDNILLIDGFTENSVSYETVASATKPNESKVLRKTVFFNRTINGNKTLGVSRIVVTIGQNGEITDLYCAAKDISNSKKVKIKDFDTAYSDAKKLSGMLQVDEDAKKVNIKKVTLGYWEDCSPNSTQKEIQPVYILTGETLNDSGKKGEFSEIVSAIPDELTKESQDSTTYESTPKLPNGR